MCGIVGYIGATDVQPILISGLQKLEYRGYDSAGVAIVGEDRIGIEKRAGKISQLEQELRQHPIDGNVGIGHTRWATHGPPTQENAHPHRGCTGKVAVVHNGIIENYRQLKRKLEADGHTFTSQTDTEVLAHLIESQEGNLRERVVSTVEEVNGSYAVAVVWLEEPDTIIAARRGSPLVVAKDNSAAMLASDIPAILDHTRDVTFLEDGEIASLSNLGIDFYNFDGQPIEKSSQHIDWDPLSARKSGYKHFMLKEINEQPRAVGDTIRGSSSQSGITFDQGRIESQQAQDINKLFIIACGTSYYAGRVTKYFWEQFLQIPIEVELGSEFRYRNPPVDENSLVVGVSQSGETADTLAGVEKARELGASVVSVPNVVGSTITRRSEDVFYTHAGPEIGVASTKAFTSQLAALVLLGVELGQLRGDLTPEEAEKITEALSQAPKLLRQVLDKEQTVEHLAEEFYQTNNFLYLGRDVLHPIALEGALKLKEISYIHAEGYPAGEMKHGPIALIDEDMPVVALITKNSVYDKVFSNIEEAKARKGTIIVVTDTVSEDVKSIADHMVVLPQSPRVITPMIFVLPLQLFAYHIGVLRGTDVDQPRNLAKSVTVE